MKYCDFIDGINSGTIKKVVFSIADYPHYRNCTIESKPIDPDRIELGKVIWFYLTPDGYEKRGFLDQIKEDAKLFKIKNKGTFSLKQMWDRVNIFSIQYENGTDVFSINL